MRDIFWMVIVDGMEGPRHKHKSSMEACKEAERLAKKENRNTYVLMTIGGYEIIPPKESEVRYYAMFSHPK